jgi:catechol 2,3-dioxygenase-like lactoylglutathione lyase family enzyme
MPTSIKFYRDVLGFEVVQTSQAGNEFGWALLRLNNAELMLNTAYEDDARPPKADPARLLRTRIPDCSSAARRWMPPTNTSWRAAST